MIKYKSKEEIENVAFRVLRKSNNKSLLNNCEIVGFSSYSLTFPTKEMAQKFVECFKDLINEAYPLV